MIRETVQIEEVDLLPLDLLVSDYLQFLVDQVKILVLDIPFEKENPFIIELLHAQDTLTFLTNEGTLYLFIVLLTGLIVIFLFLIEFQKTTVFQESFS